MTQSNAPLVIGIAGGTGSGKTTVANAILSRVGIEHIAYLPHDAYYRDITHLSEAQRQLINFDHPDTLETELMVKHLQELKAGNPVHIPIYDFTRHARTQETTRVEPHPVVIAEGILIFGEATLRELLDVKIFVDTDSDIRFIRRLQRDIAERGRTMDSVIQQYLATVRPGHLEFVEPTKRFADVIILEGGFNEVGIEMLVARIKALLHGETLTGKKPPDRP